MPNKKKQRAEAKREATAQARQAAHVAQYTDAMRGLFVERMRAQARAQEALTQALEVRPQLIIAPLIIALLTFARCQELKHGFRVKGSHRPELNTAFAPSSDTFEGLPVYRAIEGTAGMYFSVSVWKVATVYSLEAAKQNRSSLSSLTVKDGRVPLGELQWKCYVDSKWQDRSVTLTALTAAEMEAAKEEVKEAAAAAQRQAALQQSKEVWNQFSSSRQSMLRFRFRCLSHLAVLLCMCDLCRSSPTAFRSKALT